MTGSALVLQQHHHKPVNKALRYDIMTATMSLGDINFKLHYILMGPPLYMQSVIDLNVTVWGMTVGTCAQTSNINIYKSEESSPCPILMCPR
jgi:hypothetical protein